MQEQYLPSLHATTQAQIDAYRKQFKTELKNGPVKAVYYANGITGQKAFGNFNLQLFHDAFDVDLSNAGMLSLFDNNGLLANRNCYGTLKTIPGDAGKFAKELWVLQFGKSDYTLTGVPQGAGPLSSEQIFNKLKAEQDLLEILEYPVDSLEIEGFGTGHTCMELFIKWFNTPADLEKFLQITYLDKQSYDTIKTNICSLFLSLVAVDLFFKKFNNHTKTKFNCANGNVFLIEHLAVAFDTRFTVPLRVFFKVFTLYPLSKIDLAFPFVKLSFRQKLGANDNLLDLPVYVSVGNSADIVPSAIKTSNVVGPITKISDLDYTNFTAVLENCR